MTDVLILIACFCALTLLLGCLFGCDFENNKQSIDEKCLFCHTELEGEETSASLGVGDPVRTDRDTIELVDPDGLTVLVYKHGDNDQDEE